MPTAEARTGPGKFRWSASSTAVIVCPLPSSVASFGREMVVYVLTSSVSVYSLPAPSRSSLMATVESNVPRGRGPQLRTPQQVPRRVLR